MTPQDRERAKALGGTPAWLASRALATGRRWRNVLFGRASMDSFLNTNCRELSSTYAGLVAQQLAPWNTSGIPLRLIAQQHDVIYVFRDRV